MGGDLISRQAAIEALQEKVFHDLSDEFYAAMQVLDELPSAQPDMSGYSDKLWKAACERGTTDLLHRIQELQQRLREAWHAREEVPDFDDTVLALWRVDEYGRE